MRAGPPVMSRMRQLDEKVERRVYYDYLRVSVEVGRRLRFPLWRPVLRVREPVMALVWRWKD